MNWDEIFGWTLAVIGAVGVVVWLVEEARNAPTLDETTPLDELLDASAGGDNLAWTDPIVLAGPDFYDGPCCLDCDLPAEYLLAFAMSSSGAPIEQAYCEEHAEFAMSDEAEWWS